MNELRKRTLMVMGALALMLMLWVTFGGKGDPVDAEVSGNEADVNLMEDDSQPTAPADTPVADAVLKEKDAADLAGANKPAAPSATYEISDLLALLAPDDTVRAHNRYNRHIGGMPDGGVKMKINYLGATLGRVFNDSNYLHMASAREVGVRPFHSLREAWDGGASLERLQSCEAYYLDNLTHSLPYLVPEAHRLLTDIGQAFRDSLQARGGGDYRIKVTSVLRTPRLVKRLRRRNVNAVDTSAHLFGTTFDISYSKFICDSAGGVPRTQEDMKNLLGEVVYAMREQGRCHVKYERKQSCFHITATGK